MSFVFLDPRQGPKHGAVVPAPRLVTLRGKRLGILWNSRPRGDIVLRQVAELLNQKHRLAEVYFTNKTYIGNAAPQELLNNLAARVDAVVVGVGD